MSTIKLNLNERERKRLTEGVNELEKTLRQLKTAVETNNDRDIFVVGTCFALQGQAFSAELRSIFEDALNALKADEDVLSASELK